CRTVGRVVSRRRNPPFSGLRGGVPSLIRRYVQACDTLICPWRLGENSGPLEICSTLWLTRPRNESDFLRSLDRLLRGRTFCSRSATCFDSCPAHTGQSRLPGSILFSPSREKKNYFFFLKK